MIFGIGENPLYPFHMILPQNPQRQDEQKHSHHDDEDIKQR
jgi:hypothetical protein